MSKIQVELLDRMGSDLTVANAARVSFAKAHETLTGGDKRLIEFLAREGHWSPFGHVQLQFRCKAPVFIARQLQKHTVGLCWNEVSRRYVDTPPELYTDVYWRLRAEDKKQGSTNVIHDDNYRLNVSYKALLKQSEAFYRHLIDVEGVAPEQARMVLPQAMMTEWYWTGSLYAFANLVRLRAAPDAQYECQLFAHQIDSELSKTLELETSWEVLRKHKDV